jgi:hypothetical protein
LECGDLSPLWPFLLGPADVPSSASSDKFTLVRAESEIGPRWHPPAAGEGARGPGKELDLYSGSGFKLTSYLFKWTRWYREVSIKAVRMDD